MKRPKIAKNDKGGMSFSGLIQYHSDMEEYATYLEKRLAWWEHEQES